MCDVAGVTDVGRVRERNEDSFLVADLRRWMLIEQTSLPTAETDRLIGASQGRLMVVADLGDLLLERPSGRPP